MIGCFITTAIDAVILIALLKTISDEDIEMTTAFIISLVASFATGIVGLIVAFAFAVVAALISGVEATDQTAVAQSPLVIVAVIAGMLVGAAISAAGLGAVLSRMYGLEIKRAFLIGAIFTVAHVAVGALFQWMFRV
jgi:hypothetical protein